MTRQVVDRRAAGEEKLAFRRLPATSTAASGSTMTRCSPRNVLAVNRKQALFAAQCEGPAIAPGYRPMAVLRLRSGVSLRVFIEREGEGL